MKKSFAAAAAAGNAAHPLEQPSHAGHGHGREGGGGKYTIWA